jgi:hypothetical protein
LDLDEKVGWKSGQQHNPPLTHWHKQERRQEDRIRRPKNRNSMRLEGKGKSELRADVVAGENKKRGA